MAQHSSGILLYHYDDDVLEVLLVHPGGPYWADRDEGAWTIPKGPSLPGEDTLEAAKREFRDEMGMLLADEFIKLRPVRQAGGKLVNAYAAEGDYDTDSLISNRFEMEWPPGTGRIRSFPEIDRAEWFNIITARKKINPAQVALIDELLIALNITPRQLANIKRAA